MKKKVFAVILAAAAICGSLSPVYAADSELVLYTWEGMFPQEFWTDLRKKPAVRSYIPTLTLTKPCWRRFPWQKAETMMW